MKKRGFKIAMFIVFGLLLATPLLYTFTRLNSRIALKGDVQQTEKPAFAIKNWLNGDFQTAYEKYINDNIGFRPIFVRVRNQVLYSLYGQLHAAYVIRGKENYLYETNYLKAYNGTDFIGTDSIYYKTRQIKQLQDSLQARNKTLIICLAPGKGSYYPEYFPEKYKKAETDSTNQKMYVKAFKELGVNHIDFNNWFLQMKDTSRYILYPKYGIHWSEYGMLLSTDSLISYIENHLGLDLPNIQLKNFRTTKKLNNTDYDIADGLNLIFKLPVDAMCYPELSWENPSGKDQPRVVVIADSFYWSMYGTGLWHQSFSPGGFWYYNRLIYPDSFEGSTPVKDINHKKAAEDNDIFIVLSTEANLPKFSWGFVETMLDAFDPNYENNVQAKKEAQLNFYKELQKTKNNISANENWMKQIREKAATKNISVDSMLTLDALWILEQKTKNQ